jgi:hypothetical protein
MGDLIKYGLLAVGGYLLYQKFVAAAPAVVTPTGPAFPTPPQAPPAPAPGVYVPPSLAVQLDTAAAANSFYLSQGHKMNAWQWAFIWKNSLGKPDIPDLPAIFFPSGMPADQAQFPLMSAADFVAALATKGISGLGAFGLPAIPRRLPLNLTLPAAAAIARARRQNYVNLPMGGAA